MQRSWTGYGIGCALALMLSVASGSRAVAATAAVSGVVRDSRGVAQMGAMVEVLAADSQSVATAFTDMYGRYRIANLLPGKYRVRASAVLFVPATRGNLMLRTGMRATVDLTLNMLSDPASWLSAMPRRADEPGDDWNWTLRSTASRPMLRMLGDGEVVSVAQEEETPGKPPVRARDAVSGGNGGFGAGGVHNALTLERTSSNGADLLLRAELTAIQGRPGAAPPLEVDAGYEHQQPFLGASRLVVSYASHPELISAGGQGGLQVMRMASARRLQLGDAIDVEAGGTVYAIHTSGTVLAAQPFLKVTVHPGEVWAVRYRLATSPDLADFDGLDSIATALPVAAMDAGKLCTASGNHQELGVSRKIGRGRIEAVAYHDAIAHATVAGVGAMNSADMAAGAGPSAVVVDTATGSFRFLGAGYTADGVRIAVSEPLTTTMRATVEYATGRALSAGNSGLEQLQAVGAGLSPQAAQAALASLSGKVVHSGTALGVSYRWQPAHLVTPVDAYEAGSDQQYLSFYVRQALRWGDRLPPGLEATVDVTNLLAEGYRPFLSADGRTLFLAQAPRAVEGGLSFTF